MTSHAVLTPTCLGSDQKCGYKLHTIVSLNCRHPPWWLVDGFGACCGVHGFWCSIDDTSLS